MQKFTLKTEKGKENFFPTFFFLFAYPTESWCKPNLTLLFSFFFPSFFPLIENRCGALKKKLELRLHIPASSGFCLCVKKNSQ